MNVLREPIGHIRTIEPGQIRDFTGPFSGVWLIERLCQASAALRREMDKDYRLVRAEWIGGLKLSFFQRRS